MVMVRSAAGTFGWQLLVRAIGHDANLPACNRTPRGLDLCGRRDHVAGPSRQVGSGSRMTTEAMSMPCFDRRSVALPTRATHGRW
jgi:hypothetical protein